MHIKTLSTAIGVITVMLVSATTRAEDARLPGVFVNTAQSEQPIRTAIDTAAAEFNFLTRPIARSRVKKTNPSISRVDIARTGDDITIQLGSSKPSTTRPDSPAVKWSRDDQVFDLTLSWEDTTLTQSFVAPDGKRINRYRLSADGNTLSLEVTIISDQLKKPMRYTLTFAREPVH